MTDNKDVLSKEEYFECCESPFKLGPTVHYLTAFYVIFMVYDGYMNIFRAFFSKDAADDDLMVNIIWVAEAVIEGLAAFCFIVWTFGCSKDFLVHGYALHIVHSLFNAVARILLAARFKREQVKWFEEQFGDNPPDWLMERRLATDYNPALSAAAIGVYFVALSFYNFTRALKYEKINRKQNGKGNEPIGCYGVDVPEF